MPPRYKQEIEASGLSQKEWYANIYLKSDHWKALKKDKAKEVGRKCQICGSKKKLEFHHDNYREIYDVTTADLRILCHKHHHEFHFGVSGKKKPKQASYFNISHLDLRSPSLANQVLPLLKGLKNCQRNTRLNIILKKMRAMKMRQEATKPILALKSGAKARRLRDSISGADQKWNKPTFEHQWSRFLAGRKSSADLVLQFQNENKKNLRLRHNRALNLLAK